MVPDRRDVEPRFRNEHNGMVEASHDDLSYAFWNARKEPRRLL